MAEYAREPLWYMKSRNIIIYVLGLLEVLLLFRFMFKLLAANPRNGFVAFIYSLTGVFINAFSGIFKQYAADGAPALYTFEPATIIGMLIYAITAWGILRLLRLKFAHEKDTAPR